MNETLRERIIALLSRDINRLYSISEISKQLKSAYSHCNTFVNQLAKDNIIKILKIANASICTLNINEPLTRAYLTVYEYNQFKKWSKKNKPKTAKINLFISRISEGKTPVDSIIINGNSILIVLPFIDGDLSKEIERHNLGINHILIDRRKLFEIQPDILPNRVICYGAEKFWESVKKEIKLE